MDEEAMLYIALRMSVEMEHMFRGEDKSGIWFRIFKEVDDDHSGVITYDELLKVIRNVLKMKKADLTDDQVRALWCALDVDDSNSLQFVEFLKLVQRANKQDD